MATEHNDLVSADEARRLLEGTTPGPWACDLVLDAAVTYRGSDAEIGPVHSVCRDHYNDPSEEIADVIGGSAVDRALLAAAPRLAHTVIARDAEVAELRAELARVEADAAERCARASYAVGADSLLSEARAEIHRLHETLRAVARACTLPEDTAPAALPAQVEACIRDLSGQIERLTLAAKAATGAEDALAGLVALKTAAARAYLEMDGGRTDAITPEVDSGAEPRLALTLDLGGTEGGEPWQALVIYDAGMGTVPVTSGECCGTPRAAVASLREDLEPNQNDDTEDDCEFDHV